jgi:4'-phosphopantetheinyl transferase
MMMHDSLRESTASRAAKGPDGPPEAWSLAVGECHVWCARLDADAEELTRLQGSLSRSERERAGCFRFENDRRAYILSHGILRSLLGCYLGTPPDQLHFSSKAWGKPYLARPSNPFDLRFNLSHSNRLALYAFTRCHEIGVDIECLRGLPDWTSIADRIFSPREWAELVMVRPEARLSAFFSGWTRKEAVLKTMGEGIAAGMRHIEVSLTPGLPPHVLAIRGQTDACSQWTLHHLVPAPDFVAAIAVQRPNVRFSYKSWPSQVGSPRAKALQHSKADFVTSDL